MLAIMVLSVFTQALGGTFEEAAFRDGSFDAVFCRATLEHLHDPIGTLREIRPVVGRLRDPVGPMRRYRA